MSEFICAHCNTYFQDTPAKCPACKAALRYAGAEKNVVDRLAPNCLIHRYQGSDLLEPAQLLKTGKVNAKVAVRLKDLAKPLSVPKAEVFQLDEAVLSSINALREERCEAMRRFDERIGAHWQELVAY